MSIISVESVCKSYSTAGFEIKNVSIELEEGKILAVLGQSGSGKTTLVKMLAGLLQPDMGQILFKGKRLEGPDEKLVPGHEEIRLVHQDFKLYHRMTVEENILNALIQYEAEYKKDRTAELLELCRISGIKDQYVHEISGGEKQRVAIAMALATEPKVLLFDEPFSNLDFLTKINLLQEIEAIAKATNTSVVLITHDSRDALEVADYIIVLHQGEIIRRGTAQQVYHQPQYTHVANLLGLYTHLQHQEASFLSGNQTMEHDHYGLWAEDVLLHVPEGVQGRIKKVIFSGHLHKLLIATRGFEVWAYDHSGKLKVREKIKFSIRPQSLFHLK